MEWDFERERRKRAELLGSLRDHLVGGGAADDQADTLAASIFNVFVTTSPPEKEGTVLHLMVLGSGACGPGRSTKPGNVTLHIGKLFEAIAAGVLTAVGLPDHPITAPCAALVLWCSLWRAMEATISETEAAVPYVMWMNKNAHRDVADVGLLERCNQHLTKYGRRPLSDQDVRRSLQVLERIGTIRRSPRDGEMWWLRE